MSAPMGKIIRIDGLVEATGFLSSFPPSLKTRLKQEFDAIGNDGVKNMQNLAHVRTGRMKSGIRKGQVTESQVTIEATVGYSGYENNRGNPHDFFSRGTTNIEKDAQTRIKKLIDGLIASNGK